MRRAVFGLLAIGAGLLVAFLLDQHVSRSAYAQGETPLIKKIGPDIITAGSRTFTLRVTGRRFAQGAKIKLDGIPLDSTRVLDKKGRTALAEVDASVVASPGTHTVEVENPDGMTTASRTLEVVERDPELRIRLSANAAPEDSGQILFIGASGEGFNQNTKGLVWGSSSGVTEFFSETELGIEIPFEFGAEPARIPVMVRNKGDRYSNVEIFFIVPEPANITFVEPDTIEVGDEDFEIRVGGTNFKPGAKLVVGGIPLETTPDKRNLRLTATVPAALRASPGIVTLRVEQEGLQSPDSTIVVTPSEDPFIFTLAPNRVRIGERRPTIDLSGANFGDQVTAFIDGEEARIRSSTRRRLTIALPEGVASVAGTHTVQVKDQDEKVSNVASFEVVPDVMVSTLVGERDGFNEACVPAEEARFRRPRRFAFGADGLLYVTDQHNHAIRTIDPTTGQVCTLVGTGVPGYHDSGNPMDAPPTFSYPNGIAVDSSGTIFVSENGNNVVRRIRRIGASLTVDTFAGRSVNIIHPERQKRLNSTRDGIDGFRDGEAGEAEFRLPDEIVAASDGSLYLADANNHSIRRVSVNGGRVEVETVAGNGVPGFADGDGVNARFNTPTSVALSLDGKSLFVADMNNSRIRRIDLATKRVETYAGGGGIGLEDGPPAEASFFRPIGLAIDADGVLYVSEFDGNVIRRVDTAGNVTTLAGDPDATKFRDGEGLRATFNLPRGLAIDRTRGFLYVADYENFRIRKIALR